MSGIATVVCPACWQAVELQVDPSAGSARYTEDCPICCQPMTVILTVDETDRYRIEVEAES